MNLIPNEKAYIFWNAVISHEETVSLEILKNTFEQLKQTGVLRILEEIETEMEGIY